MIYDPGYVYCCPAKAAARRAVFAHFRSRGIPEKRWEGLWWRWVHQKGYRPPSPQTGDR